MVNCFVADEAAENVEVAAVVEFVHCLTVKGANKKNSAVKISPNKRFDKKIIRENRRIIKVLLESQRIEKLFK
jgi:hypothetical protein